MDLPEKTEALFALCDHVIDGTIGDEDRQRLERMVLDDPELRRLYVEYMHQHAGLEWHGGTLVDAGLPDVLVSELGGGTARANIPAKTHTKRATGFTVAAVVGPLALAAGVIIGFGVDAENPSGSKPVATLMKAQRCSWAGGVLPTEEGARLAPGKLRLLSGVATIAFDSGASIQVEGPAELDLVSPMACALHQGSLVANVPPRAIGFSVQTASARVVDYGTNFGVIASQNADTQVQVFDGLVEAKHEGSKENVRLTTGQGVIFSRDVVASRPGANSEPERSTAAITGAGPNEPTENRGTMVALATSFGRGRAAYVQSGPAELRNQIAQWASLLLIKNTPNDQYRRKAYITFDLSRIDRAAIAGATLTLSAVPSGLGYLTFVPDATFTVHAVTDDALDDWQPDGLQWTTAPANRSGAAEVDPDRTVAVGTFIVRQGETMGTFSVSGDALTTFLSAPGNDLATFVIVRETPETQGVGYVHAFAGNHHANGAPPTLRLTLKPSERE